MRSRPDPRGLPKPEGDLQVRRQVGQGAEQCETDEEADRHRNREPAIAKQPQWQDRVRGESGADQPCHGGDDSEDEPRGMPCLAK